MPSALPDPVLTPWRHALRPLWTLQPDMHFLNHGSFGAAPKSVLRAKRRWQARLERQPVHFMRSVLPEALQRVRGRLATWLGDLRSAHNLNLIPMNEHGASAFREPGEDRVQAFAGWLKARGCFVTVRRSRGRDVQGACGQLVKERA